MIDRTMEIMAVYISYLYHGFIKLSRKPTQEQVFEPGVYPAVRISEGRLNADGVIECILLNF